jgi:hypothetical protein
MAQLKLDFSGIPEFQPNNLHIVSMGHIPGKAVNPIWNGMPMTGTAQQYLPLGYTARNGLGEELMYVRYLNTAAVGAVQSLVSIRLPETSLITSATVYSFVVVTSQAAANAVTFYAYPGTTSALPVTYGWARLLVTPRAG